MQTPLLTSILFAALLGGCAGSGQFTYQSEATAPDLVTISPNVQVIADLDEPIFYSGNYYWRNEGGFWYRSPYHTHGWARVQTAPVEIRTITRPRAYVHYHGGATVLDEHRAPPRDDHRDDRSNDNDRKHY